MKGIIYCAVSPSGKKYFGRTIQFLSKRKYTHNYDARNGSQVFFHRAIRKYGEQNIKWEIIEEVEKLTKIELINYLNEREIYHINKNKSIYPDGYNLTKGGGNFGGEKGLIQSEETIEKRRQSMMGKNRGPKSPETIRKQKETKRLNPYIFSEEQIEKMRLKRLGKSPGNKGKSPSQETKEKMSRFQRQRTKSEEERKNISLSKMGDKNPMYGKTPWNKGLKIKNS